MSGRPPRDFTGWLPEPVAAAIAERGRRLADTLTRATDAATGPGYDDDTTAPGAPTAPPPMPGYTPTRASAAPSTPPPSVPPVRPVAGGPPPTGGRSRGPLLTGVAVAVFAAVALTTWKLLPHDDAGKKDEKGGSATPTASTSRTASSAENEGEDGGRTYQVVFEKKPFTMSYPSTGYTNIDLDVPKAVPSQSDSSLAEWTYKYPGLGGIGEGMVIRTPTGISKGTTPEECRSAVDSDALPGDVDDKRLETDFAEGSVLCTVTEEGRLAMVEITEVRDNGGTPDLIGEVTVWKIA
jgi:hypothetical protein